MSVWRVIQAVCLLGSLSCVTAQVYDDEIKVRFMDYFNEISEGEQPEMETDTETTPQPCSSPEFSKWDKLFTMLENSQMKENMLLQHSDDLVRVELRALRDDVLRLHAQSCSASSESHARRAELRLQQAAERLGEAAGEQRGRLDAVLEELREQARRVPSLETCCGVLTSALQEATGRLQDLMQRVEINMEAALHHLPPGCDMALFFPMRSARSYAEIAPLVSMETDALTVCLWVKPTQTLDKAVLFSYGTGGNPLELQLLLNGQSALFTVGGEAHLVEAPGAVLKGTWTHLCSTWASEHGMATLWVNGRLEAQSPGVAEGHRLLDGGALILGQEYSCQGRGARFGFQGEVPAEMGFLGKMSGVNVWSQVLLEEEISKQAGMVMRACSDHGNLVAWGVSPITRNGAVELVF